MPPLYVLVMVCSTAITFPVVCQKVQEPDVRPYATFEQCSRAVRGLIDVIKAEDPLLAWRYPMPPKPWNFKGFCLVPVIDETFMG